MEPLVALLVIGLVLSGPVAFLLVMSLRARTRALEMRVRQLENRSAPTSPWPSAASAPREPVRSESAPPTDPWTLPEQIRERGPSLTEFPITVSESAPHEPRNEEVAATEPATPIVTVPPSDRRSDDWEQYVGGSLLNRIGITLLVLGIAFALGYTFNQLEAGGKSLLASAVSIALIASGCFLERKADFVYQARGLIAGGWAALYTTAYAMHGLAATRIIEDPLLGVVVLLGVGTGMIVHSLRYAQQSITAIAYGLAYAAIVVHSIETFTLAASIVLGAGTIAHLVRRSWYGITYLGLGASYGSLFLWFQRQTTLDERALHVVLAAIGVNWLVFLVADFVATEPGEFRDKARVASWMNAALGVLLATACCVKSDLPGRHWPALVAGLGYLATSIHGVRSGRDTLRTMHPILAAAALAYAAWLGLDLRAASWVWLAEAELAFLIGQRRGDPALRRLGATIFILPLAGIVLTDGAERARYPLANYPGAFEWDTLLFTAVAFTCLVTTHRAIRPPEDTDDEFGRFLAVLTSYGGFVVVALALYVQLPSWTLAPVAIAIAFFLHECAARFKRTDLLKQSGISGVAACWLAFVAGIAARTSLLGHPVSIFATLLFALGAIALAVRGARHVEPPFALGGGRHGYAWLATFALATMISREVRDVMHGPWDSVIALVLVTLATRLAAPQLRGPAYFASFVAIAGLLDHNVGYRSFWWESIQVATITTLPSLFVLALVWWDAREVRAPQSARWKYPYDELAGRALTFTSYATLVSLLMARMELAAFAHALPGLVLGVASLGYFLRDADLRLLGHATAIYLLLRVLAIPGAMPPDLLGLDGDVALVLAGVTALAATGLLERHRVAAAIADRRENAVESFVRRIPDLPFLLAVAVAVTHAGRTREGFALSVAWALEGLVATALGFLLAARGLRIGGLFVLGLALAFTLWRALTTFDTIGRIISFLVLGGVLVALSLVYAKRREATRLDPGENPPST